MNKRSTNDTPFLLSWFRFQFLETQFFTAASMALAILERMLFISCSSIPVCACEYVINHIHLISLVSIYNTQLVAIVR